MAQGKKGTSWLDAVPARLRARLDALIDCRGEPLGAIYRRFNLARFAQPRTWRAYAGPRRRRIQEYDAQRRREALRREQAQAAQGGEGVS